MNYSFCDKREAESLLAEAKKRIPGILAEFSQFFPNGGKVGINVWVKPGVCAYSVPAALTYGGEAVREYSGFDLLELDLLNMELSSMRR